MKWRKMERPEKFNTAVDLYSSSTGGVRAVQTGLSLVSSQSTVRQLCSRRSSKTGPTGVDARLELLRWTTRQRFTSDSISTVVFSCRNTEK